MKTVLFIWEIGDGLGHVAPLAAVARELAAREAVRPVFVLRDPLYARRALGSDDWPVIAAPLPQAGPDALSPGAGFAQILLNIGFARAPDLQLGLRAWEDLFGLLGPDLIVADHSPTAILAARGRIPTLAIGTGFTMPPHQLKDYPSLRKGVANPGLQDRLRDTVNAVLKQRDQAELQRLPELLDCDARAVFSLPQLDPYGALRRETLLGHYETGLAPAPPAAENTAFFYSRAAEPNLDVIVEGLAASGVKCSAYVTGADSAATNLLRSRGATVFDEPPALSTVLTQCALVVSHGGAGLTAAALCSGRPQVILPIHVESEINGLRVAALGSGHVVEDVSATSVADAVRTVAEVRLFHEHAASIAASIAGLSLPDNAPGAAADMAVKLLKL